MKSEIKFIIILFAAAVLFTGCGSNSEPVHDEHDEHKEPETVKLSAAALKEIGLQTEAVKLQSFSGMLKMPAKILVNQDNEARVGSLIPGRVYKVYAKPGDYVKAGDVLMTLEGLEIGEIKAAFLSAKAGLDYNKANYERQKTLSDQKISSQKSLFEAQAEYEKALAEYNAQDKKIHSIGLSDSEIINNNNGAHTSGTLSVKAPISGVVVERNVVTGQFVDGTINAFRIFNTGTVWVDGQVYEKDLNKINDKSAAVFTTTSYPGEKFTGRISFTGYTVDEQSRTVTVRGEFSNPGGKLKPQMFGELQIAAGENSMALIIPAESVIKIDNEDYVFVQNRDSSFAKRKVLIGSVLDDKVEIKEGVNENDKLVVKGAFYLKSEMMKDLIAEDEH
jgi:cobalt-zinc-cadmium efflux system membrane fusion protein